MATVAERFWAKVAKVSRECVQRECSVEREFDYSNHQAIVTHGNDRFAGDLTRMDETMREYDRWVDFLHARDDALAAIMSVKH